MGMFTALRNVNKISSVEQAFGVADTTSTEMRQAIMEWFALYFDIGKPNKSDGCQRIPVTIVNKLYKTVFSEYSATVSGAQNVFLSDALARLDCVKKRAMQMMLVGGECFIKPVIFGKRLDFVVVRRDAFVPFSRDGSGKITSVGCAEQTTVDGRYYTLLERRTVEADGALTIENRLYVSMDRNSFGTQVPLNSLEKYAELQDTMTIPNVFNLGMVQLRTPMENTVDGSSDPVSVYAPAVGLILNINRNERQLDDEFENGASRIIASADMISEDERGNKRFSDTLFVGIDDNPDNVGVTIFSPALREASYLARKQEYLRNCESLIGLKRGILSEVEAAERTATEITSSAGDYNLTIQDFQEAWEEALRELLCTCVVLGQHYGLTSGGDFDAEKELVVNWGDGVLFNREKVWSEYTGMVAAGLLKPEIAVAWYFDEPWESEADMQKIRERYMPVIESLTAGD